MCGSAAYWVTNRSKKRNTTTSRLAVTGSAMRRRLWLLWALATLGAAGAAQAEAVVEAASAQLHLWPVATRAPPPGETPPPTLLTQVRDGCWCGPALHGSVTGGGVGGGNTNLGGGWASEGSAWDDPSDGAASSTPGGGGGAAVCRGAGLCRRVPSSALAALAAAHPPPERLSLSRTEVRALRMKDFAALPSLRALSVDGNGRLEAVQPGAFDGLPELRFLSLSFNPRLRRLSAGALRNLLRLTELRLEGDGLRSAAAFAPALATDHLPRLQRLSLSSNALQRLLADDLLPLEGSGLRELRLALCELQWVEATALRPLRRLRALHLGQNAQLNASAVAALVAQMADDAVPLEFLGLNEMGFRSVPPPEVLQAAGAIGVTSLVLARNQFPRLAAGDFPSMPRLRHLDLSECLMVTVEEGTLGPEVLPALRSLTLSGNQLTAVSPGVLPPQLTSLDLSLNAWDRSRHSVFFDLGEGRFTEMSNLTYLNISFNNINTITPRTFKGLVGLRDMLSLENSSIVEIQPGSFKELANLTFLNLDKNSFPEYSGLTSATFEGLDSLEVLLLTECGITNFSDPSVFSTLGSLQYLMLENNHISSLQRDVVLPLTALRGLDLSHNRMEPWVEDELFTGNPNLSIVFLADNKLTYLSPVMLEDFSKLVHLDLFDNPFSCECEPFYEGKEWLNKNNLTLERIFSPGRAPLCYSPDSWRNKFITDFIQLSEFDGECPIWAPEGTRAYIIVGVVLGMLMVLGAVCGAMAYKYRSYIRYWMFLARRDLRKRGLTLRKERRKRFCKGYTNYQYDAFVSYSSEDRNFVVRMVAMLENYEPHLKLCVYERDFQIGTVISEAVLESVACSRHTLLVISDAFARSQWCMWELRLAEHYSLFFDDEGRDRGAPCAGARNQDPLVMVKLGDVAASHMTPTLKHLLRTRVYLDWDSEPRKQRQFWEKLRAALAPPPPITTKTTVQ